MVTLVPEGDVVKLNYEISIDASLEKVWAAFDNTDNMSRWQQNLHAYTHISGDPGQSGSVAELVFDEKGKKVVLRETITERREPVFLAGTYQSGHGTTVIVNHFAAIDENATRLSSWCKFSFTGFMRFMAPFIRGVIRKRTEGDMQRFKLMVETDEAGNES
jgi:uncharacterized protein YndB with AHSA1/START domain